jgi:hypothetical protein
MWIKFSFSLRLCLSCLCKKSSVMLFFSSYLSLIWLLQHSQLVISSLASLLLFRYVCFYFSNFLASLQIFLLKMKQMAIYSSMLRVV